jgi:uncharacterized protein (TIGR03435 family)
LTIAAIRIGLLLLAGCLLHGQTADTALTFDVASIKPAAALVPDGRGMIILRSPSGGPGSKDPGRIDYPHMNLRTLLMNAYNVKQFQIDGPAWLDSERFDLTATMPPTTTREQFRVMLQNLLAQRFQMKLHRDTRELPLYSLVVARNGSKLKEKANVAEPADSADSPPPLPSQPKVGPDGFPVIPKFAGGREGVYMIIMPGRARLTGQGGQIQELADRLTALLAKPVTDATGLTAKYDFILTFSTEGMIGPDGGPIPPLPPPLAAGASAATDNVFRPDGEAPQDIFAAVQSQLGLKLEPRKGPVEMIVVDRAEKTPTEN